ALSVSTNLTSSLLLRDLRLVIRKLPPSPEHGHFTSTILCTSAGTLSSGRSPLVSNSSLYPFSSNLDMSGTSSRSCNIGSPPVNSISPEEASRATSASISTALIFLPPENVYSLSHQVQRRLHPASRTKTHGKPLKDDSP